MQAYPFNDATVVLLGLVTGLPEHRLRRVRVMHRRGNWLRAPWFPAARGGGGISIGDRIYVTPSHDPAALGRDRSRWFGWILLMAHEVGHVPQADAFGAGTPARVRYVLWAARNYFVSFLKHGRNAHGRAAFEIEADAGRRRLRRLMELTGACSPAHGLIDLLMRGDAQAMRNWALANQAAIDQVRSTVTR